MEQVEIFLAGKIAQPESLAVVEHLTRTKSNSTEAAGASVVVRDSVDTPVPAPSRSWFLFVALLLLPISAGALSVYLVGFRFQASATISVAPAGADVDASNAPAMDLSAYKSALVDTVLQFASSSGSAPADVWNSLKQRMFPRESKEPNHRVTGWRVATVDNEPQLTLSIQARTTGAAERLRENVLEKYRTHLRDLADEHTRRTRDILDSLIDQHKVISDALKRLGPQPDDDRPVTDDESLEPLEMFQTIWRRLDQPRQNYLRLRRELDEIMTRRRLLTVAPASTLVQIDPQKRNEAYESDVALQEDLRHVQVQLVQVRRATLNICEKASAQLADIAESTSVLADIAGSRQATDWSGEARTALEQVSDVARRMHALIGVFNEQWRRLIQTLDTIGIESGSADVLEIHEELASRVKDFNHEMSKLSPQLDEKVLRLEQFTGDKPHHHLVSTEVSRQHFRLSNALRAFEYTSGELDNPKNYMLAAALQSGKSLLHRIRLTRNAIDAGLQDSARTDAERSHQSEIERLDEKIDSLQQDATSQVDQMLSAQQDLRKQSEEIPGYVDAVISRGITTNRRDILAAEVERLESAIERTRADLTAPVDADRVKVLDRSIDRRPINILQIVSYGLLAWSLVFLLVLAFHRVCVSARARRSAALFS